MSFKVPILFPVRSTTVRPRQPSAVSMSSSVMTLRCLAVRIDVAGALGVLLGDRPFLLGGTSAALRVGGEVACPRGLLIRLGLPLRGARQAPLRLGAAAARLDAALPEPALTGPTRAGQQHPEQDQRDDDHHDDEGGAHGASLAPRWGRRSRPHRPRTLAVTARSHRRRSAPCARCRTPHVPRWPCPFLAGCAPLERPACPPRLPPRAAPPRAHPRRSPGRSSPRRGCRR